MGLTRDEKTIVGSIIAWTAVLAGTGYYIKVLAEERAKRRKIEEWKLMNLDAIAGSRNRIVEKLLDPNVPFVEAMRGWQEENEFLDIIRNQPKY